MPAQSPLIEDEIVITPPPGTPRPPGRPARTTARADGRFESVRSRTALWDEYPQRIFSNSRYVDELERRYPRVYENMADTDPQVSALVETQALMAVSQPPQLQASVPRDDPGYPLAIEITTHCTRQLARLEQSLQGLLFEMERTATIVGHCFAEIVWELGSLVPGGETQLLLKAIKPKPRDAYIGWTNEFNDLLFLTDAAKTYRYLNTFPLRVQDIPPEYRIPPSKFLKRIYNPQNGLWTGTSDLRDMHRPFVMKIENQEQLERYMHRFAQPIGIYTLGANAPPNYEVTKNGIKTTVDAEDWALERMEDLHGGAAMVVRDPDAVTLIQADGSGEAYITVNNLCNQEMSKGASLQVSATEPTDHQARSWGQIGQDLLQLKPLHRRFMLSHMLRHDLLRPMVIANYGPQALPYVPDVLMGQYAIWDFNTTAQALNQGMATGAVLPSQLRSMHIRTGQQPGTYEEYELLSQAWTAHQKFIGENPGGAPQQQPQQGANANAQP